MTRPSRFVLLVPLAAALGCYQTASTPPPAKPTGTDLDFPVGSFTLTDQDGKPFTEKNLEGKVWVASFVFTRCTGPCPAVTATVARLQTRFPADRDDLKFVTFTVDPSRDRPQELKDYAKHFQADPKRWVFLTGDERRIHELMQQRFKLGVARKTGENVKPGDEFDHSTRLVVVDRKGVIRATFDGIPNETFPDAKDRFEENLKSLTAKVTDLLSEH